MLVTKLTAVFIASAGCTFTTSVGLNGRSVCIRWIAYSTTKLTRLKASTAYA